MEMIIKYDMDLASLCASVLEQMNLKREYVTVSASLMHGLGDDLLLI